MRCTIVGATWWWRPPVRARPCWRPSTTTASCRRRASVRACSSSLIARSCFNRPFRPIGSSCATTPLVTCSAAGAEPELLRPPVHDGSELPLQATPRAAREGSLGGGGRGRVPPLDRRYLLGPGREAGAQRSCSGSRPLRSAPTASSILPYFGDRPAAEMRLWDALEKQLLAPFEYYGLADGTDLSGMRWARGTYDAGDLERLYTGNDRTGRAGPRSVQALARPGPTKPGRSASA